MSNINLAMRPSQPLLAIDPQSRRHDDTSTSLLLLRDLFVWPFQWLTYAALLYSSAYLLLTLVAYLAVVPIVLVAAFLVPYAVLRSLLSLLTQRFAPYWYPWSVLYACTRPLLIIDVWLHNQFARRSQCIAVTYDLSRRHHSSCEDQPRFVLRMIDVESPSALMTMWAYLLVVRSVVGVALGVVYIEFFLTAVRGAFDSARVLVTWRWMSVTFAVVWGPDVNCGEHVIGCAGSVFLVFFLAAAPRSLVTAIFGHTTRFFCSESVLVLSDSLRYA